MEQTDNLARVRINARQIRAFAQIALVTGPRQVLGFVETPMLSRGDVLDVKGMIAVVLLAKAAVFTSIAGPFPDLPAQLKVHQEAACPLR